MTEIVLKSNRVKVPESFVEANDYLYEKGWTDGLPVIPPTPERVRAMLATVDSDPQETVPPRVSPGSGCRHSSSYIASLQVIANRH